MAYYIEVRRGAHRAGLLGPYRTESVAKRDMGALRRRACKTTTLRLLDDRKPPARRAKARRRHNPADDVALEQIRRVVFAIHSGLLQKGAPDTPDTQRRAFRIAHAALVRGKYLVPGTWMPTAKGRRRAIQKANDPEAFAKRAMYEAMLAKHRKGWPRAMVA
jgi:hypothetical protein